MTYPIDFSIIIRSSSLPFIILIIIFLNYYYYLKRKGLSETEAFNKSVAGFAITLFIFFIYVLLTVPPYIICTTTGPVESLYPKELFK
jgi:hypothetical protein